ncbi:hypothetical protein D3C81_1482850 [compost metagenome]
MPKALAIFASEEMDTPVRLRSAWDRKLAVRPVSVATWFRVLLAARRWRRKRSPICSTVIGVARIPKGASIAGGALQKRLFA